MKDLTALDYAIILLGLFLLNCIYTALRDEPYIASGTGLQNGVLQVTEAGK